jgi:hypothetical protein
MNSDQQACDDSLCRRTHLRTDAAARPCPGVIDSDVWNFLDDDRRERLRQRVTKTFPAHRIGSVDDIGQAAVFRMTNPYVTGTVLEVTGGEQFAPALEFAFERRQPSQT